MRRFIRYLYEYGQGKRLRNVGFVKVEQGEEECTLHIHGKGLHMKGERQLALYLFYEDNGECVGIYQGTVDNVNPAVNYRLYYTNEDVVLPDNFVKINGIVLESETGHKYAAFWNDSAADVGHMRVLRPEDAEEEHTEEAVQRDVPGPEGREEETESRSISGPEGREEEAEPRSISGPEGREEEAELQEEYLQRETGAGEVQERGDSLPGESSRAETEVIPGEDMAASETDQRISLQEEGAERETDLWRGPEETDREEVPLRENGDRTADLPQGQDTVQRMDTLQGVNAPKGENPLPIENPSPDECKEQAEGAEEDQSPPVRFQCTKIQRNDLARLPRCEWKWANNSFLLHGYYNYHHLALINDGEKYRLGVPGIYHPQEAKAASTFGFTEFIPYSDIRMDLDHDEKSDQEQFGYWCRQVKRPLKM